METEHEAQRWHEIAEIFDGDIDPLTMYAEDCMLTKYAEDCTISVAVHTELPDPSSDN